MKKLTLLLAFLFSSFVFSQTLVTIQSVDSQTFSIDGVEYNKNTYSIYEDQIETSPSTFVTRIGIRHWLTSEFIRYPIRWNRWTDDGANPEVSLAATRTMINDIIGSPVDQSNVASVNAIQANTTNNVEGILNITDNADGSGIIINSDTDQTTVSGGVSGASKVDIILSPNSIIAGGYTIAEIDAAASTSLITKEWFNAKVPTGSTDDQTAAEVSYDNASSGLTANNTQDAIDEINAAVGSGLSSDNQNKLNNAPLSAKDSILTAAVDSLYLDYAQFQSGTDVGRNKLLRKNDGRLDLFPTSETIPINTTWRLRTGADNDTIALNPANGYTIVFDGQTTGDAAYITGLFQSAYVEKTGTDTLRIIAPELTEYTYIAGVTDYYPTGNAASDGAGEANSIAAFDDTNGFLSIVTNPSAAGGTWAIRFTANGTNSHADIEVTGLNPSSTYTLQADINSHSTSNLDMGVQINNSQIVSATTLTLRDNTRNDVYTTESGVFQPTGTSVDVRIAILGADVSGDSGDVDRIIITEN